MFVQEIFIGISITVLCKMQQSKEITKKTALYGIIIAVLYTFQFQLKNQSKKRDLLSEPQIVCFLLPE